MMRNSPFYPNFLLRDPNEKNHQFRSALKQRWGKIWRVRIGKERGSRSVAKWCLQNLEGEYARSDGCEMYYFSSEHDAILFQIGFS